MDLIASIINLAAALLSLVVVMLDVLAETRKSRGLKNGRRR